MERAKKIIVFTTPTCVWCRKVKKYLQAKKLRYTIIDVSSNKSAFKDMVRKSGQTGVPQIWIDNKPVVGFDKVKLDKLLK
ncbi:MAG: NrdH-redoxin [Candidatus Cloacimonetes bacterium 4572_65]|nr:MAG: NrdH-redoxin [Candidatus Cloacimonetes bacterium 4572_65]